MKWAYKWVRIAAHVVAWPLIAVFIAVELFKVYVPAERFRTTIIETVRREAGLNAGFRRIEWLLLRPGVALQDPYIEAGGKALHAEKIEVEVSLLSLFTGDPRLALLKVEHPVASVLRNADGKWDLEGWSNFFRPGGGGPSGKMPNRIIVTNGQVLFRDEMAAPPLEHIEAGILMTPGPPVFPPEWLGPSPGPQAGSPAGASRVPGFSIASRFLPPADIPLPPPAPAAKPKPKLLELRHIDFSVKRGKFNFPTAVSLKAELFDPVFNGKGELGPLRPARFEIILKSVLNEQLATLGKNQIKGRISADYLYAASLDPYISRFLPEAYLRRIFSGDIDFSGKLGEKLRFSGGVIARPAIPSGADAGVAANRALSPREIHFEGDLTQNALTFEKLDVHLPEATVYGKAALENFAKPDPDISFTVNSGYIEVVNMLAMLPPALREEPYAMRAREGFRNGKFKISGFSYSGPISALYRIAEPENIGRLSGSLELVAVEFKTPRMAFPVEQLYGIASVEKGNIIFNDLTARYGKSRIKSVSGSITDFMAAPFLRATISADIDAGQLRDEAASVTAKGVADAIRRVEKVSGVVGGEMQIEANLGDLSMTRINAMLTVSDLNLSYHGFKTPVEHLNAVVRAVHNSIDIAPLTLSAGKVRVSGNVRLNDYRTDAYTLAADLKAEGDFSSLAADAGAASGTLKGVSGPATLSLKADGGPDDVRFAAETDVTGADAALFGIVEKKRGVPLGVRVEGRLKGQKSLDIAAGELRLKGTVVPFSASVTDIKAPQSGIISVAWGTLPLNKLAGVIARVGPDDVDGILDGSLRFSKKDGAEKIQGKVTADIASLNLAALTSLKDEFPVLKLVDLGGKVRGKVSAVFSGPSFPDFYGAISGKNASFFAVLPKKFTVVSGTADLRKDVVSFHDVSVTAGNSSGEVSGYITLRKEAELMLSVRASRMDLEDFVYMEGAPDPAWFTGPEDFFLTCIIRAAAKGGHVSSIAFQDLDLAFRFGRGVFRFAKVNFSAYRGRCHASGTLDINPALPAFKTDMAVDGVELESFFSDLWPEMDEVTGKLDADGHFFGNGVFFSDFRNSLGGEMHFKAVDGLLAQFKGISDVFSVLNVVPMFEKRTGRQKGKGLPYDSIAGSMQFYEGNGHSKDISLEGAVVRMSGVGDLHLKDGTVDFLVAVKPFTSIDTVISNIPIAGHILAGDQKSFIRSYYHIQGKMSEPEAVSVPGESVARTVFGIFQRILEAPAKALSVKPTPVKEPPPPAEPPAAPPAPEKKAQ